MVRVKAKFKIELTNSVLDSLGANPLHSQDLRFSNEIRCTAYMHVKAPRENSMKRKSPKCLK